MFPVYEPEVVVPLIEPEPEPVPSPKPPWLPEPEPEPRPSLQPSSRFPSPSPFSSREPEPEPLHEPEPEPEAPSFRVVESSTLPDYVIDEPDEVPPVVVPEPEPEPDLSGPLPEFVVEPGPELDRHRCHRSPSRRRKRISGRFPTTSSIRRTRTPSAPNRRPRPGAPPHLRSAARREAARGDALTGGRPVLPAGYGVPDAPRRP